MNTINHAEQKTEELVVLLMGKHTQAQAIKTLQEIAHASMEDKLSTKEVAIFIKRLTPTTLLKGEARREAIIAILTETFESTQEDRKGPMKKKEPKTTKVSGNVIDIISEAERSTEERRLGLKISINAATSTAITLAMLVARNNRDKIPEEPTLETRNVQDIEAAPRPIETEIDNVAPEMSFEAQLSLAMQLRVALILDYAPLIRYTHGVPDKYDVLLSPQEFLAFRIKMAGKVAPETIARGAAEFGETEALVREIMTKDANVQQQRLKDIKFEVLDLLNAHEETDGSCASATFDKLPTETKERLKDRIAEKVNVEYKRLFPIALRTGDLELSSLMTLYKALYIAIKEG